MIVCVCSFVYVHAPMMCLYVQSNLVKTNFRESHLFLLSDVVLYLDIVIHIQYQTGLGNYSLCYQQKFASIVFFLARLYSI